MLIVVISFVIFNANGLAGVASDLGGLFGAGGLPLVSREALYYLRSYAVLLVVCAAASLPVWKRLGERIESASIMTVVEPVVLAGLLLVITASLVDGSFNPFLYFRF